MATPLFIAAPASADQVSSLVAERQQLQQQLGQVGGSKAQALQDQVNAQNSLNNNQALLDHNAGVLADLRRQQETISGKIDATRAEIDTQRHLLGDLTRGQYKTMSNDSSLALIFSSENFGQLVNQVIATQSVGKRIGDTARKLKADEKALVGMSADLATKNSQAQAVQGQLEQENGRQLAMVAESDARVNQLDGSSQALLARIGQIDRQIAALQAPPPSRFGSGTGSGGGGGSCGNHFYYGYCTWYVANRRCIPWFGDAWQWYSGAQQMGYPVGNQARVGAVAVWDQRMSGAGHVAYVESVQPNGFTVSEMNYNAWGQVDTRFVPYSNPGPLTGFIYGR